MASIANWIYDKPLRGNYTFTHDEVKQAYSDMSAGSIARALTREVSKGRIMSPLRGFYVIVPDEYVLRGAVPQSFYLDDMMHHLGRKYYVALLSAASYHGASHQVPLRFSVMIEPPALIHNFFKHKVVFGICNLLESGLETALKEAQKVGTKRCSYEGAHDMIKQ